MNRVSLTVALCGYLFVVIGMALIYHPLGWLAAGAMLLYVSTKSAEDKKPPQRSKK